MKSTEGFVKGYSAAKMVRLLDKWCPQHGTDTFHIDREDAEGWKIVTNGVPVDDAVCVVSREGMYSVTAFGTTETFEYGDEDCVAAHIADGWNYSPETV